MVELTTRNKDRLLIIAILLESKGITFNYESFERYMYQQGGGERYPWLIGLTQEEFNRFHSWAMDEYDRLEEEGKLVDDRELRKLLNVINATFGD